MKILLILILLPCFVIAQPQQSADFRITKSVIDGGGVYGSSTDFRLTSAFGQPSPLSISSSADFKLSGGFLSPQFAVSPLSPIQDLVIVYNMPDLMLYWGQVPGARSYHVYRAADPLFTPSPLNELGVVADTFYTDFDLWSTDTVRYYYNITASTESPTLLAKSGSGILQPSATRNTRFMPPVRKPENTPDMLSAPAKSKK
jgi:hypothetical protein